jgi:hypothetical protein
MWKYEVGDNKAISNSLFFYKYYFTISGLNKWIKSLLRVEFWLKLSLYLKLTGVNESDLLHY